MKNIYKYIAIFLTVSMITMLFFYFPSENNETNIVKASPYSLKVVAKDSFFIYEVYNNDNLYIRQEYIPAAKGKQIFKTKEDAEKIGKMVVTKLSKNMLPGITIVELTNNNIKFDKI
ncbi:DUF4907 domain-containing protein [Lacinutrix sp. MEBiC02595]